MKAIKVTQELKNRNNLFEKTEVGSYYKGEVPNTFWGSERIVGGYGNRTDLHIVDGWKDFVEPQYNTETHRRINKIIEVDGKATYEVSAFTLEELNQQQLQKQEMNKLIEKEKIKEAKVNGYVESQLTVAEKAVWYPEWVQKTYAINEKVSYKGKPFNNTVAGNINAPDKGGWLEIK